MKLPSELLVRWYRLAEELTKVAEEAAEYSEKTGILLGTSPDSKQTVAIVDIMLSVCEIAIKAIPEPVEDMCIEDEIGWDRSDP